MYYQTVLPQLTFHKNQDGGCRHLEYLPETVCAVTDKKAFKRVLKTNYCKYRL